MPPRVNGSTRSCVSRALQSARPSTTAPRSASVPATASVIATSSAATNSSPRYYATATLTPSLSGITEPQAYVSPTQPPSARRPDSRKSQLLRSYTAMLRSTPLMLFFQHNNLTAVEWAAIRRELRSALAQVDPPADGAVDIASAISLQVLRTRIFDVAYKITEYFDPEAQPPKSNAYSHDLSATAYEAIKSAPADDVSSNYSQISPLLIGPVCAVTFPAVSPAHLAAVLRTLAPSAPAYPAPTRKKSPGWHDPVAQSGLQKLILVGGRVEERLFDLEGVKWVGGIEGGLGGLRAQLVTMLQSAGMGLTTALEGHGKGLWMALEGRRTQLDEEANPGKKEAEEAKGE